MTGRVKLRFMRRVHKFWIVNPGTGSWGRNGWRAAAPPIYMPKSNRKVVKNDN